MGTLRTRLGFLLVVAVPVAVLAVLFVYPLGGMVARGFWVDGTFAPQAVAEALARPRTRAVVWFTLWSAAAATVVTVIAGVPVAFVLYRLRIPAIGVWRAVVLLPFVLPTVVVGVAFRQLFAPAGPWGFLGLDQSAWGIVAALVFFNISVVVRTVGAFWEGLDPRVEEAARVLGASPLRAFYDTTLRALWPSIVAAATIVFLFCSTAFGVVLTMGGLRFANVETEIYHLTTQELDLSAAAALSMLQLMIVVALLAISERAQRRRAAADRLPPAPRPPHRRHLPVLAWTLAVLAFLLAPLTALTTASFRSGDGWTLTHYAALARSGGAVTTPVLTALANSLTTAAQATLAAMLLGILVSFAVTRRAATASGRRALRTLDHIVMLPLGVSAVTLGFGLLVTLARPPLALRDSPWLVPLAQALVALPLVVRAIAPVLRSVDQRLRDAAASLGAGPIRVVRDIDVPLARRSVLAATGFAFAVSLGEFGATSFLVRDEHPTLPVLIYRLIGLPGAGHYGMAMAASVILAVATAMAVLAVERLRVARMGAF